MAVAGLLAASAVVAFAGTRQQALGTRQRRPRPIDGPSDGPPPPKRSCGRQAEAVTLGLDHRLWTADPFVFCIACGQYGSAIANIRSLALACKGCPSTPQAKSLLGRLKNGKHPRAKYVALGRPTPGALADWYVSGG